jgi:23S rRNA pseudouridine1911/1915/1917 synthase
MKHLDKDLSPDIIYLDNHILVVEKPGGLLTQADDTGALSLEDLAKEYLKKKFSKEGKVFLHPIHRIDKEASGLVLFARTSKALSRLNEQMRAKQIKKKYRAIVEGFLKSREGKLVDYLLHKSHRAEVSSRENGEAKEAVLFYEVMKEIGSFSLLSIDLITGRYHQIRAQLSALGHPIVGDKKYGSQLQKEGLALQSFSLEFIHPVRDEKMAFKTNKDLL